MDLFAHHTPGHSIVSSTDYGILALIIALCLMAYFIVREEK